MRGGFFRGKYLRALPATSKAHPKVLTAPSIKRSVVGITGLTSFKFCF